MATWKKIIVSGSNAELAQVTASIGVLVGSNQFIGTTQATTRLTGSFTGSFTGDGTGLTGVTATATFPTVEITDLASANKFFTSDGTNSFTTYGNLLTDLAGTNLAVESTDSLTLASTITGLTSVSATSFTGSLQGSASYALTASFAANVPTTASYALQALSSSFATNASTASYVLNSVSSSFATNANRINTTTDAAATHFPIPFVANSTGTSAETLKVATNTITIRPSDGTVTTAGGLFVNGAYIRTATAGTFNILQSNATTIAIGASDATTVSIGNSSSTTTVGNNLIVPGDLTVNGTLVNLNVTNVNIEDQFILLASGSAVGLDAGIIASSGSLASGSAMYHDITDGRWSVAKGIGTNVTTVTPLEYVTTVKLASGAPSTQEYGKGEMYINTADDSVWIYS